MSWTSDGYGDACDVDQKQPGGNNLSPDGEIHSGGVMRDGRPRVVKKSIEAEATVNRQYTQTDAKRPPAVPQIAQKTYGRDTAPGQIDIGAGPRRRQVWILSQILCVVREVQEACASVYRQKPGQHLADTVFGRIRPIIHADRHAPVL